jgi:hypothetical protein
MAIGREWRDVKEIGRRPTGLPGDVSQLDQIDKDTTHPQGRGDDRPSATTTFATSP